MLTPRKKLSNIITISSTIIKLIELIKSKLSE
jgi:hypothetical protein